MDEADVVVLGTGLKQMILAALLAQKGMQVFVIDRNDSYGGETASLNLEKFWNKFRQEETPSSELFPIRDWNFDLTFKLVFAAGNLVKLLLDTGSDKYLEWNSIEGRYQYYPASEDSSSGQKETKLEKIDEFQDEDVLSGIISYFKKNPTNEFIKLAENFDLTDETSTAYLAMKSKSLRDLFDEMELDEDSIHFIGHGMAMNTNDDYLYHNAIHAISKIKVYLDSLNKYSEYPFLYPTYGIGEIPISFSRGSAIYGTNFLMKTTPEIIFDANGIVGGVKYNDKTGRSPIVIADPSYVKDISGNVKVSEKRIKCIGILDHQIEGVETPNFGQIIIPNTSLGRNSDITISFLSEKNVVCKSGYFLVYINTIMETPNPENEIAPAVEFLGEVLEQFTWIEEEYCPLHDGTDINLFITKSYDSSIDFENDVEEVLEIYKRIQQ